MKVKNGYIDKDGARWKAVNAPYTGGKIYFGFLSTGMITASGLWAAFFALAKEQGYKFEIGVHSAQPFRGEFKPFVLKETVPTTWEDTVEAHTVLIKDAKKMDCDKFVLLSDSCVPLNSPKNVWERLLATNYSFAQPFKHIVYPAKSYAALPVKPPQIYLTEQWFCADKKDFGLWTDGGVRAWYGHKVANEKYLYPLFYFGGKLDGLMEYHYHHVNWNEGVNLRSPRTYKPRSERAELVNNTNSFALTATFNAALVDSLWGKQYLFGRKFAGSCDFDLLLSKLI